VKSGIIRVSHIHAGHTSILTQGTAHMFNSVPPFSVRTNKKENGGDGKGRREKEDEENSGLGTKIIRA